ncbi:hypothetical protein Adt_45711 [Abeliophyllum distichum]|uniref:Uncharacterized protein n=1 Tax=Abeliophyllum distichum TaxID=126358 RepID=A0ABD1PEE4_9LAMI
MDTQPGLGLLQTMAIRACGIFDLDCIKLVRQSKCVYDFLLSSLSSLYTHTVFHLNLTFSMVNSSPNDAGLKVLCPCPWPDQNCTSLESPHIKRFSGSTNIH